MTPKVHCQKGSSSPPLVGTIPPGISAHNCDLKHLQLTRRHDAHVQPIPTLSRRQHPPLVEALYPWRYGVPIPFLSVKAVGQIPLSLKTQWRHAERKRMEAEIDPTVLSVDELVALVHELRQKLAERDVEIARLKSALPTQQEASAT